MAMACPNRLQHYYQFQVVLKPAPEDILELSPGFAGKSASICKSKRRALCGRRLGKSTLGAWGLGWEVWLNGMESLNSLTFSR